jgi:hypothetical protein
VFPLVVVFIRFARSYAKVRDGAEISFPFVS